PARPGRARTRRPCRRAPPPSACACWSGSWPTITKADAKNLMAEIRFYHLTARTFEQTLPVLLDRTLQRGWRAVVCVGSEERAESLAGPLWTYSKEGFLPHGTKRDGFGEEQPVWISDRVENPNAAQVLFLGDGADSDGEGAFATVCDLFDGNDPEAVQ